jgi:leucyl/phenylalanyl-tRNA--protein transferase
MTSRAEGREIPFNEHVLKLAYSEGCFPMGIQGTDEIQWYRPDPRAIIPLELFHISKSLRKTLKKKEHTIKINQQFETVIRYCMSLRKESWITEKMIPAYVRAHQKGFAHSLEVYQDEQLAGGLYGISMSGVFCAESMFHLKTNASKIALCELVFRMRERGMVLLDIQFSNPHTEQFHVALIRDEEYDQRLKTALALPVSFV